MKDIMGMVTILFLTGFEYIIKFSKQPPKVALPKEAVIVAAMKQPVPSAAFAGMVFELGGKT